MIYKDYQETHKLIAVLMADDVSLNAFGELEFIADTLTDCRNELCSRCGKYENAHEGACDKCRWR